MSALLRFRHVLLNQIYHKSGFHTTSVQQLYSSDSLGIDGYIQQRKRMDAQFEGQLKTKFLEKMEEFVQDGPKNMIFTEDLKNMVHIADPKDVPLALRMLSKFNTQTAEYRFGSFVFGPVVMRMFHYLDCADEALQCFNDNKSSGFFDQLISYQILLDLLYQHARYDDMRQVFKHIMERQINMTKYPKYPVVLIFAACYKQNTKESLEYASKLMTEMAETGATPLRRAAVFLAALALNQGAPHVALEVISSQTPSYVTVRNIKARALAEMGRVDDALPLLRSVLDTDRPESVHKHTFFNETIEAVRLAVKESGRTELTREFDMINKSLQDRDLIDKQTLAAHCESEIKAKATQDKDRLKLHASYQEPRRRLAFE